MGQGVYAVKSKASLLLALVIKRSGPAFWEAASGQLLALGREGGAAAQEVVGHVIKYVADEVTQFADDIQVSVSVRVREGGFCTS
jgi:exportin-5